MYLKNTLFRGSKADKVCPCQSSLPKNYSYINLLEKSYLLLQATPVHHVHDQDFGDLYIHPNSYSPSFKIPSISCREAGSSIVCLGGMTPTTSPFRLTIYF